MVVNDVVVRNKEHRVIDIKPVFRAYEMITGFHELPYLNEIYNQYNEEFESHLRSFQAALYPDDFYDGGPDSIPMDFLPDSVSKEMSEVIGMSDLEIEDIIEIFERFCMFYMSTQGTKHAAVVEVW